jgi:hypothetical protein
MIEHIQANAEMTIQQLRPLSRMDFGYTPESVNWLEGYIERLRQSGKFTDEATRRKLVSVLGSFLGECIVRCYGGGWTQRDGVWCVAFPGDNLVFPFTKVSKQMERGLEDGIRGFFDAVPVLLKEYVRIPSGPPRKPWWKFW